LQQDYPKLNLYVFTTVDTIAIFPVRKQTSLSEDVWGNVVTSPRIKLVTIPVLVASFTPWPALWRREKSLRLSGIKLHFLDHPFRSLASVPPA